MRALVVSFLFLVACGGCVQVTTPERPRDISDTGAWAAVGLIKVSTDGERDKTGTGWVVMGGSGALVVTAGHVCPNYRERSGAVAPASTVDFVDNSGRAHRMTEVLDDDDIDACVLSGPDLPSFSLSLSDRAPRVGERLTYVGYPAGDFSIVDGRFTGTSQRGKVGASLHSTGGASGSPVLDGSGKVAGMLVEYRTTFDGSSFLVPLEKLRSFIRAADEVSR